MNLMGFTTTSDVTKADAAAGATKLDAAAKTAVKNGLPYIGYSYSAASSASDLIPGVEYTELDGAMDCLTPVVYPNKTLVNASYIADGDDILYAYGLGYFSKVPASATVLVKSDKTKTPTEGFIPTNTAERAAGFKAYLNGGVQGFAYKENGMNVVLFANSLTHKVHQRDEYAYLSNFLFSSVLSDKNYDGSASLPFTDVADDAYYADAVAWAVAKNITSGATATTFAPNAAARAARCHLPVESQRQPRAEVHDHVLHRREERRVLRKGRCVGGGKQRDHRHEQHDLLPGCFRHARTGCHLPVESGRRTGG